MTDTKHPQFNSNFVETVKRELSPLDVEMIDWVGEWLQSPEYASAMRYVLYKKNGVSVEDSDLKPLPYPLRDLIELQEKVRDIASRTQESNAEEGSNATIAALLTLTIGVEGDWVNRLDDNGWWSNSKANS